jgi:hypothetical protein
MVIYTVSAVSPNSEQSWPRPRIEILMSASGTKGTISDVLSYVRYWHLADMTKLFGDLRFRG